MTKKIKLGQIFTDLYSQYLCLLTGDWIVNEYFCFFRSVFIRNCGFQKSLELLHSMWEKKLGDFRKRSSSLLRVAVTCFVSKEYLHKFVVLVKRFWNRYCTQFGRALSKFWCAWLGKFRVHENPPLSRCQCISCRTLRATMLCQWNSRSKTCCTNNKLKTSKCSELNAD